MTKGVAQITTSLDGYITGPDDGPGRGLGIGANGCTAGSSSARGSFVDGLEKALAQAREAGGDKQVSIMGGPT